MKIKQQSLNPLDIEEKIIDTLDKLIDLEWEQKLTEQELEVMRLCSLGMKDNDIANYLKIKHTTVRTHYDNIKTKLNLDTSSVAFKTFLCCLRYETDYRRC